MKKHTVSRFIFIFSVFVLLGLYYNKIFSLSWAASVGVNFYLTIIASTGSVSSGNQNTGNISTGSNKTSIDSSKGNIKTQEDKNKILTGTILTGKTVPVLTGKTVPVLTGETVPVLTGKTVPILTGKTVPGICILAVTGGHYSAEGIIDIGGAFKVNTINTKYDQTIKALENNIKKIDIVEEKPKVELNLCPIKSPILNKKGEEVNSKLTEIPEKEEYKKVKIVETTVSDSLKSIIKDNIESFPILNEITNKIVSYAANDEWKTGQIENINIGNISEKNNNGFSETTKSIFTDVLTIYEKNNNPNLFISKKTIVEPICYDVTNTQKIKDKLYSISTSTMSILRKNINYILPLNGTILSTVRSIFKYFK